MKELYTIGETAALMGITTRTLRYYNSMGLISPSYTDPDTGYRYYSFKQFPYIDRIKYLQSFGLSLESIKEVILSGSVETLLSHLNEQREKQRRAIEESEKILRDIEWYIEYFTYGASGRPPEEFYRVHLEERYILNTPCFAGEPVDEKAVRLAALKSRKQEERLAYRRQYGFLMDFDAMLEGRFLEAGYFVYLREKPAVLSPGIRSLPAGEYLCFRSRIFLDDIDTHRIRDYIREPPPHTLVIANEYEDNLKEYERAEYEIQILL